MANEADSRDTTPTVRWGETAAEVPGANITEPSGGVKDVGWVPGVSRPNGNWWNWLHWADGVFHRYVENAWALLWQQNMMMPGGTGGAVTAGAGLSVNVTAGQAWIQGAFYRVPSATNLALAAADPTDPRIDIIVGRVSGGLSEWHAVTGTPATPAVAPTPTSGQTLIAQVRVNALAVAPTSITDEREFGSISVDHVVAVRDFEAGDYTGSGDYMLSAHGDGAGGGGGQLGDGQLIWSFSTVSVQPEFFAFQSTITRKHDLGCAAFQKSAGSPTFNGTYWTGVAGDAVVANIPVQHGATITTMTAKGTKTIATDANLTISVRGLLKTDNSVSFTEGPANNDGDPVGDFSLSIPAFSRSVPQTSFMQARILFDDGTGGTVQLWGVEVEYTESKPFDGL